MGAGCAAGMHDWVPDGRFYSWLKCGDCGAPAVCKACHGRGADLPMLPDVFCPTHAPYAADLRTRVLTGPLLGARIISLAQSVRDYLEGWSFGDDGWRLRLVVGDLEVWLHQTQRGSGWRVVLLYGGRLVYHAEGGYPALVVKVCAPGRWVTDVQQAQTWRHGVVQYDGR